MIVDLHQPERRGLGFFDRHHRDGHIRVCGMMMVDEQAIIHPVEMITREDQIIVDFPGVHHPERFSHRIGGALKPIRAYRGLLRRENIHKSFHERVEAVRIGNVLVQRRRIELC